MPLISKTIQKIDLWLTACNRILLVAFTFLTVFFALLNIVLRWFGYPVMFIDPLVRILVFAIAFLGAFEAMQRGQNISIDILRRFFEEKKMHQTIHYIDIFIGILTAFACFWLCQSSIEFVKVEFSYPRELFWIINTGVASSVIPLGFGALGVKSLLGIFVEKKELEKK